MPKCKFPSSCSLRLHADDSDKIQWIGDVEDDLQRK